MNSIIISEWSFQYLRVRKTWVQNFWKALPEFHVCDIRTRTNDIQIKLCFYFKFQREGKKKNLLPEWGMRTYGQSITWLPNSTTKASTCLLIPRGKTLLCLPGPCCSWKPLMMLMHFSMLTFTREYRFHIRRSDTNFSSPLRDFHTSAYWVCAQEHQASAAQLKQF